MLFAKNIYQKYKQGDETIIVLENLNLKINKSTKIGLVGSSGSGKSTLLNIIGLIENPISGEISIDNVNCNMLSLEEKTKFRKSNISYIFQNNQLLEDFTSEENVALPLMINGISYVEAIKKARKLMKKIGLLDRIKFKPSLLSGGEQQRLAVLRAIINRPKILLADEPTGSLDNKNALDVLKLILELTDEEKTITIIATHNNDLLSYLDICFRIDKGKLVEIK